ncbi:uncharacterized protein LOC131695551 [Topomyia yanbarensis]|uniref:uncharacterized protein LOC131695551 n=1 Tax=Topomyia yanbarensis TaxID=2498891 RepID=UPI00273AE848|nr:uncharacterized protein LOC131695551 [Topomyia yanbarensis]
MQRGRHLNLVLLLAVLGCAQGKNVVDITDYFQDCENGKPLPAIDVSELESLEDDNGNPTLNGKFKIEGDYNDPIKLKVYSKRLKQGTWTNGEISRDIPNLCLLLTSNWEPWYPMSSKMQRKKCPYNAGHVETFDNILMGDMGMDIPDAFSGEWQMYIEATTSRGGEKVTECVRLAFTIKEI